MMDLYNTTERSTAGISGRCGVAKAGIGIMDADQHGPDEVTLKYQEMT